MKKILVILCLMILALPVFAEYKPIPVSRSAEYRAEIEAIIKRDAPKIKRNIDKVVMDYHNEKDESIRYTLRSIGLDTTLFDLYNEMINITDKYVPIKKDMEPCGHYYDLEDILYPYLVDNHISMQELIELHNYKNMKQEQIGPFP